MRKKLPLIIIAVIVVILGAAIMTKPDDADLRKETADYTAAEIQKLMPAESYAPGIANNIAEIAVVKSITIEDKLLWKEVVFSFNGTTRTLGHGYFGSFHPAY